MGYECMNIINLIPQLLEAEKVFDNAFINFNLKSVKARVDIRNLIHNHRMVGRGGLAQSLWNAGHQPCHQNRQSPNSHEEEDPVSVD